MQIINKSNILSESDLESIRKGLDDVKNGRVNKMSADESMEEFLDRIDKNEQALTIIPALRKRIEEAKQACGEGRCVSCRTEEELNSFLDSL